MRSPRGATALLAIRSRPDGINELTWALNSGERAVTLAIAIYRSKVGMPNQAEHLNTLWDMLDDAYKEVVEPSDDNDFLAYNKTRARTLCDTLAVLMKPFYENSNDVAREAGRRYKAAVANDGEPDPNHVTPGLAEQIWDNNTTWNGQAVQKETTARAKPVATKVVNNTPLPPEAVEPVKAALKNKMMTVAQIAKMYGVSEETVFRTVGD